MNQEKAFSRRKFMGTVSALGATTMLKGDARTQAGKTESIPAQDKRSDMMLSEPNGYNLIVIISDSFRADYLHFNGNERIRTPNLDALAQESIYFTNCYADGLPTIPARRVMHTGKSILPEKQKWHALDKGDTTLAEILAGKGFTTGFIADTPHYFAPNMNFHKGFDSWQWIRGQENEKYKSGPKKAVQPGDYIWSYLLENNNTYQDRIIQYVLNTRDRKSEDDYFCAKTLAAAGTWVEENKDNDGPFMLFVDMFDPHEPWDAPVRFQKMYREAYPFERMIFGYGVRPKDVRKEHIPILIDLYSAEITFTDYCIGRFIDRLKHLGVWDNTIVVFSTDHGTHLGEQGCLQKNPNLLNSCVTRIPWLIRHPDKRFAGKKIDALTSHLDFLPTFLHLLGMDGYAKTDGQNAWSLVTGAETRLHEQVIAGYANFGAIKTDQWYYFQNIWGEHKGLGPALYDIKVDPGEENNIAQNNPQVVADMKGRLAKAFRTRMS